MGKRKSRVGKNGRVKDGKKWRVNGGNKGEGEGLAKSGMVKGGKRGRVNSGKKGEDQGWEKEGKGWEKAEGQG